MTDSNDGPKMPDGTDRPRVEVCTKVSTIVYSMSEVFEFIMGAIDDPRIGENPKIEIVPVWFHNDDPDVPCPRHFDVTVQGILENDPFETKVGMLG